MLHRSDPVKLNAANMINQVTESSYIGVHQKDIPVRDDTTPHFQVVVEEGKVHFQETRTDTQSLGNLLELFLNRQRSNRHGPQKVRGVLKWNLAALQSRCELWTVLPFEEKFAPPENERVDYDEPYFGGMGHNRLGEAQSRIHYKDPAIKEHLFLK
jgi:hypothetical protein